LNLFGTARNLPYDFELSNGEDTGDFFGPSMTYTFKIKSTTHDMYGYISIPGGAGPFPAIIKFPPFGAVATRRESDANRHKVISISVNIFKNVTGPDQNGSGISDNGLHDPSTFFYKHGIIGAIKLIDYLKSGVNPTIKFDTSSKIGVYGDSQGGGLALIVGGLDQFIDGDHERVGAISASNPALCEHHGYTQTPKEGSGFPNWLTHHGSITNIEQNVKYYDAANFTKRFNRPIFMTIGYRDRVCPASTNLTALNQTKSHTILFSMRDSDHNLPYLEWDNSKAEFFKQYLDNNIQANATGYHINAGADKSIMSNSTSINGTVQKNGSSISLQTTWETVSAPPSGTVSFTNSNSLNTQASFSKEGTYVLRLRAQDDYTLTSSPESGQRDNSFYTLVDYITVIVGMTSDCNMNVSNPSTNQFSLDANGDTFTFTINGNSGSNWFASDDASWVSLSPSSGSFSGTTIVTASVNQNVNSTSRNATISTACGSDNFTLNITQEANISNDCGSINDFELLAEYNGHSYYKSEVVGQGWADAKIKSEAVGGYLVSIENQAEKDFVDSYISGIGDDQVYFIGLDRPAAIWEWEDGTNYIHSNFSPSPWSGTGSVPTSGGSVSLSKWDSNQAVSWYTGSAGAYRKFILEIECGISDPCENEGGDTDEDGTCNDFDCQPSDPFYPATPGTPCNDNDSNTENDIVQSDGCSCAGTFIEVGTCDQIPNFTKLGEYNGHGYYKSEVDGLGWLDAKSQSEAAGGYLVSIENQEEKDYVDSYISGNPGDQAYFIGLDRTSVWNWESGTNYIHSNYTSSPWGDDGSVPSSGGYVSLARWAAFQDVKWLPGPQGAHRKFLMEKVCVNVDECSDYKIFDDNAFETSSENVDIGIETNRVVPSGIMIEHSAGEYILLTEGFEVQIQAVFHALIRECGG